MEYEKENNWNSEVNEFCKDCIKNCKQSSKVTVWCTKKLKEQVLFKEPKKQKIL